MKLELLESISLERSSHPPGDRMCAMEAVAFIAGEKWSDSPECACPVISAFMRSWNDGLPSNADRDRLLKPLIPKIIGTRADAATEKARSMLALDWYVRTWLPAFLRLCPATVAHADKIAALPVITEDNAKAAGVEVAAGWAAAGTAAEDAVIDARWAAVVAAGRAAAVSAVVAAVGAAAGVAVIDARWAAAVAAGRAAAVAAVVAAVGVVVAAGRAAAGTAAEDAAKDVLSLTVAKMQESASDLVLRMCEIKL